MTMTVDRATHIADIIKKRRPLVERIAGVEASLKMFDEALQDVEAARDQLLDAITDPLPIGRLRSLNMQNVRTLIGTELGCLAKLRSRFARETINIGVIGRARQGKSRLLQSMSGLTANEIPDGSGSHCTGVRSTIYHDAQTAPHAEVSFHGAKSFITDVIGPYYRELKLGPAPRSVQDFASNPLPPLPADLRAYAGPGAKYEHLKTYQDHLNDYADLLGSPSRRIPVTRIREYVAQDTVSGDRSFFNYLAVQHVKVFCKFPHEDIGRIALIDMPGLGDTGIGDEERLVAVLGQDVDAVLFVKLPKATGDFWGKEDVDLYDIARNALTDLPIERWSFVVLNRTAPASAVGDNEGNCRRMAADLHTKHIEVADCIIANCASQDEVSLRVLDRVLDYLAENINALDEQYASACQARLMQVHREASALLAEANTALGRGTVVEGEFVKFDQLFKEVWADLTNGMETLLSELREWSVQPNDRLDAQVTAAIARCREDTGIPSNEEIERSARLYGAYGSAFNQCLHRVRTHLVQHFLPLEDTLRLTLEDVRSRVTDVLKNEGRLGSLAQSEGTEFLRDIAHLMPKDFVGLKSAFETLASVELTYRGFLQYRMRKHLMLLHPDGAREGTQIRVASNTDSVREALEVLHEKVVYRLEEAFDQWLSEPNLVSEAIVEEFVDNVLRALTVQDEWRNFYLEMRASIWHAEFDEIGARSRLRQEWERLVQRASNVNQASALQIMGSYR